MERLRVKKYFNGLTKNTIWLALASFFADISTEMLYPILPIFLTQYLKANGSIVGTIEGIATATQNIVQGFSGWLSDKVQKRKPMALIGYFNKADIRGVKVNDLRNTFIVFQLKSGVPIDIVSQIVGHKRISTTEKYLELIDSKEEGKGIRLKEL